MSMCTGKPHQDGKPCRGKQTIPAECFECGVSAHYGCNVDYYPDELPHWKCQRCHGGYWFWTPDGRDIRAERHRVGLAQVHRGTELVAQFEDIDDAGDYIDWKNETLAS